MLTEEREVAGYGQELQKEQVRVRSALPSPAVRTGTGSDWLLGVLLSSVTSEMLAQLLFGGRQPASSLCFYSDGHQVLPSSLPPLKSRAFTRQWLPKQCCL